MDDAEETILEQIASINDHGSKLVRKLKGN